MSVDNTPKKILIITSLCGGGHLQAARAQATQAAQEMPHVQIIEKDILIDWVGKWFGKFAVFIWNSSQKKGNLAVINFFSKNVPVADIILWPCIFFRSLSTLIKEDVDQIIDTQPLGTLAIIQAIKWLKKWKGKQLKLEKIVTELPTEQVIHFFKPIKKLSPENRSLLQLITTAPLLKYYETADNFWLRYCGLRESEVCYRKFPLRTPFHHPYQHSSSLHHQQIEIQVNCYEEKNLIANTIKRGTLRTEIYMNKLLITIEPTDKVVTILLGSQPAEEATIRYVQNYMEMLQQANWRNKEIETTESILSSRHLLFVFCNHHAENKPTLLRRLHDFIQKTKCYPHNLTIIPMCFQQAKVIASLYSRSDATFTRSGGLTSMELMTVARGQIWIHSELKQKARGLEDLHKGMPIWESGNATYLKEKKGARLITPSLFSQECWSFFFHEEEKVTKKPCNEAKSSLHHLHPCPNEQF